MQRGTPLVFDRPKLLVYPLPHTMNSALIIGFALGLRHGADPDHLTAIDGLSRIRPRTTRAV
jgi:high-affinity nickel permease